MKPRTPVFAFILVILFFFLLLRSARVVPAGHVGIVDLFGKVRAEALPSGLHLVNPLASVHRMSIQTKNLLKWKGIEATKELALSSNAKVVIIGAGKEGLPIILGGDTSPPAPHAAPPGR